MSLGAGKSPLAADTTNPSGRSASTGASAPGSAHPLPSKFECVIDESAGLSERDSVPVVGKARNTPASAQARSEDQTRSESSEARYVLGGEPPYPEGPLASRRAEAEPASAGVCMRCEGWAEKRYGGMGRYPVVCLDCWLADDC